MGKLSKEISVQMYSLREELAVDFEGTMNKLAGFGFKYIEPAGFPGADINIAAKLYESLGMKAYSMHGALPIGDSKESAIEEALMLGAKYIVSGKGPNDFDTLDDVKKVADLFSEASANAAEHGLVIGYHNHDWEMKLIDGVPVYRILMENTPKNMIMELDTYWVKVGGLDPAAVINEMGERAALIHIKDGAIDPVRPMMAAGSGNMEFKPIVESAKFAELLVIELDECATDMVDAVEESFKYLTKII